MSTVFELSPVGIIHTPYGQKFAVPRQPGLAADVPCEIEMLEPYSDPQAFIGLEGFSHIHVIFVFDQVPLEQVSKEHFKPMIRPPRLGGNQRVGVFASRSPFRPNRLGLSVLKLEKVIKRQGRIFLAVSGADMVDGTPILDIKPYIPFVDAKMNAQGGYASEAPALKEVVYGPEALEKLQQLKLDQHVLTQILAQDPRPAYKGADDHKSYFALIMGVNVEFCVREQRLHVVALHEV